MTIDSDYVVKVQAILGLTNYEFSFVLGVSEKNVESWRGGWQVPCGASAELIRLFGLVAEQGQITRDDLLSRAGYAYAV